MHLDNWSKAIYTVPKIVKNNRSDVYVRKLDGWFAACLLPVPCFDAGTGWERWYQDLRAETIKVIQGTSRLNVDLLNSLVSETAEQIKQLAAQIQTTTAELEETVQTASQVLREYDQLISWAEMYDHCTFEAKKMIVAKFVKAVRVRRDYEIDIEFNVSFEEFQALYLEGEPEEAKRPGTNTILAMETKK